MTADITATLQFITLRATDEDLERIFNATKQRRKTLGAARAATVTVGATVTIDGIRPKYLCGLAGEVQSIRGAKADILLDEASTKRLRIDGWQRFPMTAETARYVVRGVPLQCCQ